MRFFILILSSVTMAFAAPQGLNQFFRGGGHFGGGWSGQSITKEDRRTLVSIKQDLISAEKLVSTRYRMAINHVESALRSSRDLPQVPAKAGLARSLRQGLRYDYQTGAPNFQKARVMLSSINAAQLSLEQMLGQIGIQSFNLNQLEQVVQVTKRKLRQGNEVAVKNTLNKVANKANNKPGPAILKKKISAIVDFTIEKTTDPYLTLRQKLEFYDDCTAQLVEAVDRLLGKFQPPAGQFKKVGETPYLSKFEFERNVIEVKGKAKLGKTLKVKAVGDSVAISFVRVFYLNGQKEVFQNISLPENGSDTFRLTKNGRIEKIVVMAKSAVFWGTKGKVVLLLK